MKIELELNIVNSRSVFLNFWNSDSGKDVVAELKGKKLMLDGKEISFADFVKKVKRAIA
jgi:hypothetical protein